MEEKRKIFMEAVEEYKKSYEHYRKFEQLVGKIGVRMCPNFYIPINSTEVNAQVYEGIESITEVVNGGATTERFDRKREIRSVSHDGIRFFELVGKKE